MKEADKKRLLRTRQRISQKRPHFKRFESWRLVRIKDQWRKPKGIDNKMRTELRGWPKSVKVGYGGPAAVKDLHPSGYEEVMVWNTNDLEGITPETQAARIGGTVGGKKRESIIAKAEELKIKILNLGVSEPEDDFEELEDEEYEEEPEDEEEADDIDEEDSEDEEE